MNETNKMTAERALAIAEKLEGKDKFAIAHELVDAYHQGVENGMADMKAALMPASK
jgi:hypothetical protein